jgi:hypothetical protein
MQGHGSSLSWLRDVGLGFEFLLQVLGFNDKQNGSQRRREWDSLLQASGGG